MKYFRFNLRGFQNDHHRLYRINSFDISLGDQQHQLIEGITPLKQKILQIFSKSVADVYHMSWV